jgi:hypothetical protein
MVALLALRGAATASARAQRKPEREPSQQAELAGILPVKVCLGFRECRLLQAAGQRPQKVGKKHLKASNGHYNMSLIQERGVGG